MNVPAYHVGRPMEAGRGTLVQLYVDGIQLVAAALVELKTKRIDVTKIVYTFCESAVALRAAEAWWDARFECPCRSIVARLGALEADPTQSWESVSPANMRNEMSLPTEPHVSPSVI